MEVYSNSSSAPKSASRTFLRRPSDSASAAPAPTSRRMIRPPRRRFFLAFAPRSVSAALRSDVAASLSSFCVFLSSVSALTGPLPLDMRAYALRADS